ncbi:MAG: indole-3-glycerol phosphate synthase TrpC [Alphaproteobacteria bacterium]|nr:indole-3-glycerol phosphate synthase TrpC [Alphaproteobacteria bacterium]
MASGSDVLAEICAATRREVERRKERLPQGELERRAKTAPAPRGFARALKAATLGPRAALIAEIKKASPSRGLIRAEFDPPALARAYKDGGATCLSILTDGPYFQGSDEHLTAARAAVDLPVLRKDFILDPYQVVEARVIGADCILLILAALDDAMATALARLAREFGLDVLAEVHDERELERALGLEDALLGINNRNLKTLTVDLAVFERLARRAPAERFLVAESGLKTPADLARLAHAGARAFLIGESLMAQADVAAATRALLSPARAPA